MLDPATLVQANLLEVFGERDPARRAAAIERIHAPQVVFTESEGSVTGRDAIAAKAQAILHGAPDDFVFAPEGAAYSAGDVAYVRWTFGRPGQPPAVTGTDVAVIVDGRIARLYTMLTDDARRH